jgi:hypothetical protein
MKFLKKIDIYYIVTLFFLFITSAANFLSSSNIGWFLVIFFILVVAMVKKALKVRDLKIIAFFSLAYLVFVGVRDVFINNLDIEFLTSDVLFLFKYVFLTFIYCVTLKEKTISYLVKVTVHLCILSLFFYVFQLAGFGEYLYKYFGALNLPNGIGNPDYTNILFFSYTRGAHEFRNCGFFWEPGSFACFLIIVLLLNLFLNKFIYDRNNIILIIALITTVSTTGYLALLVIFFLSYRYRVPKINIWVLVLVPLSLVIIINTPNLGDKITKTFEDDMKDSRPHQLKITEHDSQHKNKQTALNRFSSMVVIYNKFGTDLILGESNQYNVILNETDNVDISNGIFDFMAKFGLIGFIFLLYKYARFCRAYVFRWELVVYCIFVFLIICTGEPIVFLPFMLLFIFLYLVQSNPAKPRAIEE